MLINYYFLLFVICVLRKSGYFLKAYFYYVSYLLNFTKTINFFTLLDSTQHAKTLSRLYLQADTE